MTSTHSPLSHGRRTLLAAGLALGLSAVLAACGGGSSSGSSAKDLPTSVPSSGSAYDSLVSAAKKEGKVVFYNSLNDSDIANWTKPFTEKYGIEVQSVRMAGAGPLYDRWNQEWNARRYLVDNSLIADPSALKKADKQGMVAAFTPSSADGFIPSLAQPGKGYPMLMAAEPMTWNTTKVTPAEAATLLTPDGHANFKALTDSRWKNRLGVLIPNGIPINQAEWDRIVGKYGWGYLSGLAKNKPKIYESAVPLNDDLSKGEISLAVFDSTAYSAINISKGAPFQFAYDDKAAVTAFMMAVANKAPHPNAARLFDEWATSPDAVSSLSSILQSLPGRTDVTPQLAVAKEPWYKPLASGDLMSEWMSDPSFSSGADAFNGKWDQIFGYDK